MADIQKQLCELSNAATLTAVWMRTYDALANSIGKTLDGLRERLNALQTASVSSVEMRSIVSERLLPEVVGSVGSDSNKRPSQSQTPGETVGSS